MDDTKAPNAGSSEEWTEIPWRKLEQHLYRLQKRIFKASERGGKLTEGWTDFVLKGGNLM